MFLKIYEKVEESVGEQDVYYYEDVSYYCKDIYYYYEDVYYYYYMRRLIIWWKVSE